MEYKEGINTVYYYSELIFIRYTNFTQINRTNNIYIDYSLTEQLN